MIYMTGLDVWYPSPGMPTPAVKFVHTPCSMKMVFMSFIMIVANNHRFFLQLNVSS